MCKACRFRVREYECCLDMNIYSIRRMQNAKVKVRLLPGVDSFPSCPNKMKARPSLWTHLVRHNALAER